MAAEAEAVGTSASIRTLRGRQRSGRPADRAPGRRCWRPPAARRGERHQCGNRLDAAGGAERVAVQRLGGRDRRVRQARAPRARAARRCRRPASTWRGRSRTRSAPARRPRWPARDAPRAPARLADSSGSVRCPASHDCPYPATSAQDPRAARQGALALLEHEDAGALAHHESVPAAVERPRRPRRVALAGATARRACGSRRSRRRERRSAPPATIASAKPSRIRRAPRRWRRTRPRRPCRSTSTGRAGCLARDGAGAPCSAGERDRERRQPVGAALKKARTPRAASRRRRGRSRSRCRSRCDRDRGRPRPRAPSPRPPRPGAGAIHAPRGLPAEALLGAVGRRHEGDHRSEPGSLMRLAPLRMA